MEALGVLISAWSQMAQRRHLPPGPTPLPVLGNLLELKADDILKSFKKLSDRYGPVYTVHLGPRRVVVLHGYEAVKEALVDFAEEFSGRGYLATVDDFVQGLGIAFANGERWKQLRRFTLNTLRNFGMGKRSVEERIQEEAHFLVEEFRKTKGVPFDPTFFLSRSVSNVICSIMFGQRFDYQDKDFLTLLTKINENFVVMSGTWGQLYEMFSWIMKYLPGPHQQLFRNLSDIRDFVAERIKVNEASLDPDDPRDFIDCFLIQMEKESKNLSSEFHLKTLAMTVLVLFIAGTETVSSTLRFGFLILMKYPEVQAKVFQEIDDVIGKNRLPVMEDRAQMPYTDAVIHEIQRFSDVIPMNLPHALTQTVQFRGYTLPKGTNVFPLLTSVLKDPGSFSDPEKFNPGHFLDEQGRFKKNDAFLPFSTGKRICAGAGLARTELFIFLTSLLQNFTLRSPVDPQEIDLTPPVSGFANIPPTYQLCAIPRGGRAGQEGEWGEGKKGQEAPNVGGESPGESCQPAPRE
ncbi:cytochrome P450 2G1-like isoform X2 [Eublepharis macularius]|uniref:Cytochrome P450 2G1-like isoform X2 n=1 Tax=Eublepharis macularius TaxID=481883 RepID=A0AA97LHQ1_EUBMA|nr:cytochrome P450 2G1-like isoform X2 [Eublepharis macularius]